jgi:hypothetical protein
MYHGEHSITRINGLMLFGYAVRAAVGTTRTYALGTRAGHILRDWEAPGARKDWYQQLPVVRTAEL